MWDTTRYDVALAMDEGLVVIALCRIALRSQMLSLSLLESYRKLSSPELCQLDASLTTSVTIEERLTIAVDD